VPRTMRLQFRNKLLLPLFTGGKVEGEGGSIHIVLQDSSTGQLVAEGVEANLKLEIVVLEGDFAMDDDEDWSQVRRCLLPLLPKGEGRDTCWVD